MNGRNAPTDRAALLITFDAHQCQPAAAELDEMRAALDGLADQARNFPQHDLRVLIERNSRSNDYSVKLTLLLDGTTLVTSDHDPSFYTAFDRALAALTDSLKGFKDQLGRTAERRKLEQHTDEPLLPSAAVDVAALAAAAEAGDFAAFRAVVIPYEDGLRLRAGRWVERHPAVQALMGRKLTVADLTDGVLLAAFDGYDHRPRDVPLGTWFESLIAAEVKAFEHDLDGELENVNMARTAATTP